MGQAEKIKPSDAQANPASVLDNPVDAVTSKDLPTLQKKKVRDVWEDDARRLAVATEEGMSGGESSRMADIAEAKVELGVDDRRRPTPTKAGSF